MSKHCTRTKNKHTSILNAAKKLVSTSELRHITVNDIKTAAHVSQVTIYKLFGTKDDLLLTAIKQISLDSVNAILTVIKSDISAYDRLYSYFRTSFTTALTCPQQEALIEYIFSGPSEELKNYVLSLYATTYPYLEKMYNDARNDNLIRSEISKDQFFKMCDMYTRIKPFFYQTPEEMDTVVKSIIKSFG